MPPSNAVSLLGGNGRWRVDTPAWGAPTLPFYQNIPQRKQALTYLHDRGAHFVLCRRSRQPIRGFPWGSHKPDLDCVLAHPSHVGIVPFSVETSALDVDRGEPMQLSFFHPPLVAVPSRQPGREHLYYRDDTPRGNQQWRAFGCAGEVRSAKGYLILYRDAPVQLAHALAYNKDDCFFPADLLELVEPAESAVALDDLDIANSPQLRLLTPEAPVLELVRKGPAKQRPVRCGAVLGVPGAQDELRRVAPGGRGPHPD